MPAIWNAIRCLKAVPGELYNPGRTAIHYALVESEWTGYEWQTGQMTIIGNVLQYGPSTQNPVLMKVHNGPCEIYMNDNIARDLSDNLINMYTGDPANIVTDIPVWNDNINVINASDLKEYIIKSVGAIPWDRDSVDSRIVNEMITHTGKIIDYETEVGGFPVQTPTSESFVESEWNLDYMIKYHPNLLIGVNGEVNGFEAGSEISLMVNAGNYDIPYYNLNLVINGVVVDRKNEIPSSWNFTIEQPGIYEIMIVAENTDEMPFASNVLNLDILESTCVPAVKNSLNGILFNCYPNPFSQSLNVEYVLPKSEQVLIKLLNAKGQLIDILENKWMNTGTHNIHWSSKSILPDGIFLLQFITTEQTTCYKVIFKTE